jgi:hypothetical protein
MGGLRVEEIMDDYGLLCNVEEKGKKAFFDYLANRFDFDKQPQNPYHKNSSEHYWWWVGLTDAMSEWFLT